jgi:hypothetical protein
MHALTITRAWEKMGWSLAWASDQAGLVRPIPAAQVAGSSPATWIGMGPTQIKKIKINVSKIYDFFVFYGILINISLFFYTVKIQLWC